MLVDTLSYSETIKLLDKYFTDDMTFWINEIEIGYVVGNGDINSLIIKDIQNLKNDPYILFGKLLNVTAKNDWLSNKKGELYE